MRIELDMTGILFTESVEFAANHFRRLCGRALLLAMPARLNLASVRVDVNKIVFMIYHVGKMLIVSLLYIDAEPIYNL